MANLTIANRYASSLLDTAVEKKKLDSISTDMELISTTLAANPQLSQVLSSPIVKPHVKISIIEEVFRSRINNETLSFLKFVVEKKREDLLEIIVAKFLLLKDEYLGIVNVNVKTAVSFTEEQENKLKQRLESALNKIVKFNFVIDNSLIGGFVAKVGDTVFDASLKHQLELLKKQFFKGGASLN